jgi:hypothetical protein
MVPASTAGGVTECFSDIFPSDRTVALGSTQPLFKMSTRNIPGGSGRCVRLTISPPSCAKCHENLGAQNSWNPLGHTGPVTGFLYLYLLHTYRNKSNYNMSPESFWSTMCRYVKDSPREWVLTNFRRQTLLKARLLMSTQRQKVWAEAH